MDVLDYIYFASAGGGGGAAAFANCCWSAWRISLGDGCADDAGCGAVFDDVIKDSYAAS